MTPHRGGSIVILGRGRSLHPALPRCCFADAHMAVASAVYATPLRPSSLCAIDSPQYFKKAKRTAWAGRRWSPVRDRGFTIHAPSFNVDWRKLAWSRPTIRLWPFEHLGEPRFDPLAGLDMRGWPKLNSLMFAVQVTSWMLYRDVIFCGVDLFGRIFDWLVGHLERWHQHVRQLGVRWYTASDCSRLAEFLPIWEGKPA